MLRKLILSSLLFGISVTLTAQDTLRLMVYNLLYYGQFTDYCTQSNNNPDNKDGYLKTILAYDQPDIFVVNEISHNAYYHQRILDSVLLRVSNKPFARASSQNISNSNIMNMMYYNTGKLVLHSQYVVQTIVRDINLYTLYYKSPDLVYGDTAFIHCIAAHLKAGSSSSDQQTRRNQINNVIAWLQNNKQPGNFIIMGDFNVSSAEESAMQALLFGSDVNFRFYDPVNQPGKWNENAAFAMYHTQSTHTSGSCHAGGGLDDRFDFILASSDLIQGSKKVKYVENSYRTMGQDGQHFNKSLLDSPYNASAPFSVLEALYHNSDHLPVLLSLCVDQSPAANGIENISDATFSYNNPVENELIINHSILPSQTHYTLSVYSLAGNLQSYKSGNLNNGMIRINLSTLPGGFYIAELKIQQFSKAIKIVKY